MIIKYRIKYIDSSKVRWSVICPVYSDTIFVRGTEKFSGDISNVVPSDHRIL